MGEIIQEIENGPGYCDSNDTMYWLTKCPKCKHSSILLVFYLEDKKTECRNCYSNFEIEITKDHMIKINLSNLHS